MFAHDPWRGTLYPEHARPASYLKHYSTVLNTVEGNNTFYGIPRSSTVERWREQTPSTFQFCFKFPRAVSHEGVLSSDDAAMGTREFLRAVEPLQDRVGILLLQLPPHFDGSRLDELAVFLDSLPSNWNFAVEPRHHDLFGAASFKNQFDELLADRGVSRCIFDTVQLHSLPTSSDSIREAQRKKPKFPECWTVTSDRPFLRYVGDDSVAGNAERLNLVAATVAEWIADGKTPFVFMHTPSCDEVPGLCLDFHRRLIANSSPDVVGTLPNWPGAMEKKQRSLF